MNKLHSRFISQLKQRVGNLFHLANASRFAAFSEYTRAPKLAKQNIFTGWRV